MEYLNLLLDDFDAYYVKALDALDSDDNAELKKNLVSAAEILLNVAKESNGSAKARWLKRANELYKLANKIEIGKNQ
jgi:hypothetical protein